MFQLPFFYVHQNSVDCSKRNIAIVALIKNKNYFINFAQFFTFEFRRFTRRVEQSQKRMSCEGQSQVETLCLCAKKSCVRITQTVGIGSYNVATHFFGFFLSPVYVVGMACITPGSAASLITHFRRWSLVAG